MFFMGRKCCLIYYMSFILLNDYVYQTKVVMSSCKCDKRKKQINNIQLVSSEERPFCFNHIFGLSVVLKFES